MSKRPMPVNRFVAAFLLALSVMAAQESQAQFTLNMSLASTNGTIVFPTTVTNTAPPVSFAVPAPNTDQQITAVPKAGYAFDRWDLTFGAAGFDNANAADTSVFLTGATGVTVRIKALFKLPDNTLTVRTLGAGPYGNWGSPVPAPGISFWPAYGGSGTTLVASVTSPVDIGGGNLGVCTGYVGSGSAPASGVGTSVSFLITTNSTLTWGWVAKAKTVPLTIISQNAVGNNVGDPLPLLGTTNFPYNAVDNNYGYVKCSVTSPYLVSGDERALVTGYTGTGDMQSNTGAVTLVRTMTQASTLTWNWNTQYRLGVKVDKPGTGSVTRNPQGILDTVVDDVRYYWYPAGTVVELTANQTGAERFLIWSGAEIDKLRLTTVSVTMSSPKTVAAEFGLVDPDSNHDGMPDEWCERFGLNPTNSNVAGDGVSGPYDDPDNDGLPNLLEYQISHVYLTNLATFVECNPIDADSDGDGIDDGYEYRNVLPFNGVSGIPGSQTNLQAVVDWKGSYGATGNTDHDVQWDTGTGYINSNAPLYARLEWHGPDEIDPCTYRMVTVPGVTKTVNRYCNAIDPLFPTDNGDTGDQSSSDSTDSEIAGPDQHGDGFDDGFEYSWDRWQGLHSGDPIRDPLGRKVPQRWGQGPEPTAALIGDITGDNMNDMVVCNYAVSDVSVFFNTNGLLYLQTKRFPVETGPVAMAMGHFQAANPTRNDFVVVNKGGNSVSVLLGDPSNIFTVVSYPVGSLPTYAALGDFNGDANIDIAVANSGAGGSVTVLTNDSTGAFALYTTIGAVGAAPSCIAAGSIYSAITNKVYQDLLVADGGGSSVRVIQNAAGVFTVQPPVSVSYTPTSLVLGDFDKDGVNDFVVTTVGSDMSAVQLYRGTGAGAFSFSQRLWAGEKAFPVHLAAGYIDTQVSNDLDVAVAAFSNKTGRVYLGNRSGLLTSAGSDDLPSPPVWAAIGDVNMDGIPDVAYVCRSSHQVSVYRGYGDGTAAHYGDFGSSDTLVDRRFNPAELHVVEPDNGRPDYDIIYKSTGGVGDWFTDTREYHAWDLGIESNTIMRTEYPSLPRCTNPFLWDTDGDGMPDAWEIVFKYDPWKRTTYLPYSDDNDNPDTDGYAVDGANMHHAVYSENAGAGVTMAYHNFNPNTGWQCPDRLNPPPLTGPFVNHLEMLGGRSAPAITANDPDDRSTNPLKKDTDQDGMWDGWEHYVGLNPIDSSDGGLDRDPNAPSLGDGLSNIQEFLCPATLVGDGWTVANGVLTVTGNLTASQIADIQGRISFVQGWKNKTLPTDPFCRDTDDDQVLDGQERSAFNYVGAVGTPIAIVDSNLGTIVSAQWVGSGLSPTTADTDGDFIPDYWEYMYRGSINNTNGTAIGDGMDGTVQDALGDYDGDRLKNFQEYMTGCVPHWQYRGNNGMKLWEAGLGIYGYDPFNFFDETLSTSPENFGAAAYGHPNGDASVSYGGRRPKYWDPHFTTVPVPPWTGTPWNFLTAVEPDGMHPKRFSTTDPRSTDTDWDNMDDYWEVFHMLNPIRGYRDMVAGKLLDADVGWEDWPLDLETAPWVNGEWEMDSDQDGLPNVYESIQAESPSPQYYHTDPSPYWMSDISYEQSWCNLYYWLGQSFGLNSFYYWFQPAAITPYPQYLFDFEMNEGFDTDNDNIGDRAELVSNATKPGKTDPLDAGDPIKRRALYLNGNAAARTFFGTKQPWRQFREFAVEAWVRPANPISGTEQVIVERPGDVANGNPLGYPTGIRLNFRLGLDPNGRPFIGYNGAGFDPIYQEAKAGISMALVANQWAHLAGVYDGVNGRLILYVNGVMAAMAPTAEIPFNGTFGPPPTAAGTIDTAIFMPIVVGARESRPAAEVNGSTLLVTTLAGGTFTTPALDHYFTGWVDEIRIWSGSRSQSDIKGNLLRRFSMKDVLDANAAATDTSRLVFCYGFDDLPDPDHSGVAPAGFELLNGYPATGTPYAAAPWWATAADRSLVYNEYRYVPWIENLSSHSPSNTPSDSAVTWGVTNTLVTNGVTNTFVNIFPNTSNPYTFTYRTKVTMDGSELHPFIRAADGLYGDLLPLRWAQADEDVPMWDNGSIPALTPYDSDGDGMPDDWEVAHGLDPRNAAGENGAEGDPDGDGLNNFQEYLCGTDPWNTDTGSIGISDGEKDSDGDHLTNLKEFQHGTLPNVKDTDDDGLTDWEEVMGQTDMVWDATRPPTSSRPTTTSDPLNPLSPAVQRSVYLNGSSRLIVPPNDKLMSTNWTVETWVKPDTNSVGGVLINRYMQGVVPGQYGINYELGLSTNSGAGTLRLYARYGSALSNVFTETRLDGLGISDHTNGLASIQILKNAWTHVAGVYDSGSNTMSLFVNGQLAAFRKDIGDFPPTVFGYAATHWGDEVTIGASRSTGTVTNGFKGFMDNVRIWSIARTATQIADRYNAPEGELPLVNSSGVSLKSGTISFSSGMSQQVSLVADNRPTRMVVKFASETIAKDTAALTATGVQVLNYVAPGVRAVTATSQQLANLGAKVTATAMLTSANKLSPLLNTGTNNTRNVVVSFFKDTTLAEALAAVQAAGGSVYQNRYIAGTELVASVNDIQLTALAGQNSVAYVYPAASSLTSGALVRRLSDHVVGGAEVAPFVNRGEGWDGPGRGQAYLTYHFVNYNSNLDPMLAKQTVMKGIMRWSDVAAIYFTETAEAGKSFSFDILWETIDGPGGILGFGYYPNDINPEPVAGDFHLDKDETWATGMKAGSIDMDYVSCHEGGHCLGMAHSDDPTAVMYPYYDGTRDSTLAPDDIKGIQNIYGMPVVKGQLAEFRFDDGGMTAQDFTVHTNWLQNWDAAAVLDGAVFSTNSTAPLTKDSDGDGLPDWWEMANGLDPYDGTGVNGGVGDPDNDGLSNLGEYLAGTNPHAWDSDGDGFSDYDSRQGPGSRTWGELYDDGDGIPDLWEAQYPGPCPTTGKRGLDIAYYDANLDPDEDGWSNYAEYMAGTDPLTATNFPQPAIAIHARYMGRFGNTLDEAFTVKGSAVQAVRGESQGSVAAGESFLLRPLAHGRVVPKSFTLYLDATPIATDDGFGGLTGVGTVNLTGFIDYDQGTWTISVVGGFGAAGALTADYAYLISGQLKLAFYKKPSMDGWPIATLEMSESVLEARGMTTGHLVEGTNYVFGYIDRNNNNRWEPETEPAGIGQFQPINVGWGAVNNVEIGLTDEMPGYPRFAWTAVPNVYRYVITNFVGQAFGRVMMGPRNYWHEGDWLNAGYYGATGIVAVQVYSNVMYGTYSNYTFNMPAVTLGAPSISTPNGQLEFEYAKNEMEFKVDDNSAGYRLQIAATSNGTPILTSTGIVPYKDVNGVRKVTVPFYAGDNYVPPSGTYASSIWNNGLYWARVQGFVVGNNSAYSPWSSIIVNLQSPTVGGKSMLSGDVWYFGKVSHGFGAGQNTNLTVIVQAFQSPGFSGTADGQVQISYNCNTNSPSADKGNYSMKGLRSVPYYVRAFVDLNGNRALDPWEPMGFAQTVTSNGYIAAVTDLSGQGSSAKGGVRIVIRDRDTDDDGLADGWEWMYYGSLANGSSNIAANGMTLLRNYEIEPMDLDPTKTDYDGDGVSDVDEITYGDVMAGLTPDVGNYDPYDPVTNPNGKDLNPAKWDTDGDGLSDGYEIAHGLNPIDPTDGAAEIARAKVAGETIPGMPSITQVAAVTPDQGQFSLTWQGQVGMAYEVQYSDNLTSWQAAPGGDRYGAAVHTYNDQSPRVTTRFYRVMVK